MHALNNIVAPGGVCHPLPPSPPMPTKVGQTRGDEPGQYLGDWGPSSPLWSANPALASDLLERTFPGMFWMSVDAFLEIFNTLYAVDGVGIGDQDGEKSSPQQQQQKKKKKKKKKEGSGGASGEEPAGSREGRCEGSWGGDGCGGR